MIDQPEKRVNKKFLIAMQHLESSLIINKKRGNTEYLEDI